MKIDIYPSAIVTDKYLGVPHGTDFTSWQAPAGFDPDLLQVRPLFKTLDLAPGETRVALNSDEVMSQISSQGWAAIGARVTVDIRTAP